jgi:DNA-binding CsgD family transcriptional regulator
MAMRALAREVVGRDEELAVVRDFLAAVDRLPSALLIEGEAGIGKTTLWSTGIAVAAEHGYRVLSARPAQAESQVSYAGLADLLDPVLERALNELPPPQRRALEIALVLRDPENRVPDQAAIAFALLGALRSVATDVPVVIAVDDLQWLDAPSTFALRFAARRLRDEPIGLLFSVRHGSDGEPSGVGFLSDERTQQIHVGGLSLGALQRLIQARLNLAVPRPLLKRLHESSAGNPFFALELAHALGSGHRELEPGEPLPMSGELRRLIGDRLASLPPGSDEVLLVAAATSQPTVELLGAVLGEEEVSARLRPTVAAGLVELLGERVRFAHPLYASAVYGAATPEDKRKIHRRLAAVVDDPEERARHLAASAVGANTDVAAALDEAVQIALNRGAPQAAAELAAHAVRLTPPEDAGAAHRRRLAAGDAHFEAGDTARAHTLFAAAADDAVGHARAAALSRLARIHVFEGDRAASVVLCRRALADVGDDLELRSEIEEGLAVAYYFMRENLVAAAAHARSAVEAARQLGRPRALAEALSIQGLVDGLLGRSSARPAFEEALNLEPATRDLRIMRRPSFSFAVYASWTDDLRSAKTQFESLYQGSLERGDESTIPLALAHLSAIECALGDWRAAARWADESYLSAVLTGQLSQQAYALAARALVDAHLGLTEQARTGANEALQLGREPGSYGSATSRAALGLLALSLGRPEEAHEALGPLVHHFESAGIVETGALWFVPDAIESLIDLGEQEAATALLERFAERARRLGRRSSLAAAHRCRGLLSSIFGEEEAAIAAVFQALEELASLPLPFERARALLILGSVQRRARQRRAARETLGQAQRLFDDLGASLWSERTKAELARIGGRAPSPGELTASEQRVAELVAEGRTNKEVAATLHLTERTVEGTLTSVYAKLGIRSRTELAHCWATRG